LKSIDPALLEDARTNHYRDEIVAWNEFREIYKSQLALNQQLISDMAEEILQWSGLPAFGVKPANHYVVHLAIAEFIYGRLMLNDARQLRIDNQGDVYLISDTMKTLAVAPEAKLKALLTFSDTFLQLRQPRAAELKKQWQGVRSKREELLEKLSVAIAVSKLHHRCQFVRFF
jgi:hypothetical protein